MAQNQTVSLDLPDNVLAALGDGADAAGCPPADFLRAALTLALADGPVRNDGPTVCLRRAFSQSTDWPGLQRRLRATGFALRRGADGQLTVQSWPRGRVVLRIEDLGYSLAGLVLKFGAAFPWDRATSRRARLARPAA